MKNILIPTDFSVQSLNAVHVAMATFREGKVRITLFHLMNMPDALSELLFRPIHTKHAGLFTGEFKEGCEMMQNRYSSSLYSLNVRIGFGSTVNYLKNLLEGEKITDILICPDIPLILPTANSVAMQPILSRTGYEINNIPLNPRSQRQDVSTSSRPIQREIRIMKKEAYHVVKN